MYSSSPLIYLNAILWTFVIVLPRWLWIVLDRNVFNPEFAKIKSK